MTNPTPADAVPFAIRSRLFRAGLVSTSGIVCTLFAPRFGYLDSFFVTAVVFTVVLSWRPLATAVRPVDSATNRESLREETSEQAERKSA